MTRFITVPTYFGSPRTFRHNAWEPEATTLFAAFSSQPDETRKNHINTLIAELKAATAFATQWDAFYVTAAHDSQAAKINWVNPGTFNLSEVNSPTFTTDRGFTGASTKYLSTGFNPSTASSPKYVRNSATVGAWSRSSGQDAGGVSGYLPSGANAGQYIFPRFTDDKFYGRVNMGGAGVDLTVANTDGSGLFVVTRTASNAAAAYRNASSIDTDTTASIAVSNDTFVFLSANSSQYWTGEMAAAFFGASVDATKEAAVHAALAKYMTAVGA